ncbi:MAG TPA: FeoB small GTPase domain-containing protein [Syntrophomonadaceae bacterium]|nr:FeoB small GTPase domain-containing protein [Syntrophomonadaceae bacterium]
MSKDILALRKKFNVGGEFDNYVIAIAGNPNTGKSTIFNNLTGLRQHTGNWPGKTVLQAQGEFNYKSKKYLLVDLPGTYSLCANSPDEQVARDFLCFAQPDATIAVADATCLERNLNLILQIIEITPKVVLCLNLMDEAKRKNIKVDIDILTHELGIPVVPTVARTGQGLQELKNVLEDLIVGEIDPIPHQINYGDDIEMKVKEIEISLKDSLASKFISLRWLALRMLDEDKSILEEINYYFPENSRVYV